ncbi:hypothetical protein [Fimbriimonas ginsengisoli]|uniref:hypothetical protein n=1 Tax=Fimbriimonas ginsengisoli TaxID=1005039 RepID=UPI0004AD5F93|nr:hypothetical protein [Fimbriimonas ginsengisoli]
MSLTKRALREYLCDGLQCDEASAADAEGHVLTFFRALIQADQDFKNAQTEKIDDRKAA